MAEYGVDFQYPSKLLYLGRLKQLSFYYEALYVVLISSLIYLSFDVIWILFLVILFGIITLEIRTRAYLTEHALNVPCGNCWFCYVLK